MTPRVHWRQQKWCWSNHSISWQKTFWEGGLSVLLRYSGDKNIWEGEAGSWNESVNRSWWRLHQRWSPCKCLLNNSDWKTQLCFIDPAVNTVLDWRRFTTATTAAKPTSNLQSPKIQALYFSSIFWNIIVMMMMDTAVAQQSNYNHVDPWLSLALYFSIKTGIRAKSLATMLCQGCIGGVQCKQLRGHQSKSTSS